MGRELKRKEAKRTGKNVKEVQKNNKEEPMSTKKFITIIILLIILFVLTYIFTGIFATKDIKWFSKKTEDAEETESNIENRILASESLKQLEDNYYVYFYDTTKEDTEVTSAVEKLDGKVYRVDLHDDFNSNYIGEPSGKVSSIEELKVSDPTIIKVSSAEIIEYYTGEEIKK